MGKYVACNDMLQVKSPRGDVHVMHELQVVTCIWSFYFSSSRNDIEVASNDVPENYFGVI